MMVLADSCARSPEVCGPAAGVVSSLRRLSMATTNVVDVGMLIRARCLETLLCGTTVCKNAAKPLALGPVLSRRHAVHMLRES